MPGWVEQFGRVVVEAQASGIPVVASASGALPDVVGEDGSARPPDDPVALHAALSRFLDEPGLWSRLRDRRDRRAARYSWESVAETQMALYRTWSDPGRVGRPARPTRRDRRTEPIDLTRARPGLARPEARCLAGRLRADRPLRSTPPPGRPSRSRPHGRAPRARRRAGTGRTAPAAAAGAPSPRCAGGSDPRRVAGAPRRCLRIAAGEEQPVVTDGLQVGAPVGRHHRHPVGHGLDHRQPERLAGGPEPAVSTTRPGARRCRPRGRRVPRCRPRRDRPPVVAVRAGAPPHPPPPAATPAGPAR